MQILTLTLVIYVKKMDRTAGYKGKLMLKDSAQEYQRRGVVLCFLHGVDDVLSQNQILS